MKRTSPKVLKQKRQERRSLERAILRCLRKSYLESGPTLSVQSQGELWGLEQARRRI